MTVDPLDALRGDVPRLDPLTRARLIGDRADAREAAQMDAERAEAIDRSHTLMAQQAAIERSEIYAQGYSSREAAEAKRARDDARDERIRELTEELERLDPGRRQTAQRSQASLTDSDLLRRAKAAGIVSPAVQRMFDATGQAEAARARAKADLAIAREQRDGHRPPGGHNQPVINRSH